MANTLKVKLGYNGTDKTRQYTLEDIADNALIPASVKAAVAAFNGGLSTAGLSSFFIYENASQTCKGVVEVIGESVHEQTLMGGA